MKKKERIEKEAGGKKTWAERERESEEKRR